MGGFGFVSYLSILFSVVNTMSQNCKHGNPSVLNDPSRAMISASVDECDTAPCFLHIHVNGMNVFSPTRHMYAPVVDFESFRSPAKLASQNIAIEQSSGASPTKQCCT